MSTTKRILAAATAATVALPGVALAKPGADHGSKPAKHQTVVVHGTLASVDAAAKTATVAITRTNRAGRSLDETTATFTLAATKLKVRDTDGDGERNELSDLRAGDRVVVQAKLAKGAPLTQPIAARKLQDRGPVPATPAS